MPWNPWRALRSRPHIILTFHTAAALAGGGIHATRNGRTAIVLDPALDRRARNAALAHELVHDERGGLCDHPEAPDGWAAVVAREEAVVDRIVADRLVPPDQLARYVDEVLSLDDGGVTAEMVADRFDVPTDVAQRALAALTEGARSRHPSTRR